MRVRIDRRWTALGFVLAAMAIALVLTVTDQRLASSQTVTLVAKQSEAPVPLDDPFSAVWARAKKVQVPMADQNVIQPKAGTPRTMTARALNDGDRLYVLAEWDDPTQDLSLDRQQTFSDGAAVEFPVTEGEQVPNFCMGNPDALVNIWQWKAAWQADLEEGYVTIEETYPNMAVDDYPFEDEQVFYPALAAGNPFARTDRTSAVDNLLAGVYGTLTNAEDQMVQGAGAWRDGKWRVIFARDMSVDGEYTQFEHSQSNNLAFAVWDGANEDRDGMKSVSQFLTLEVSSDIAKAGDGGLPIWAIVLIVAGGLGVAAAVGGAYALRQRKGAGAPS